MNEYMNERDSFIHICSFLNKYIFEGVALIHICICYVKWLKSSELTFEKYLAGFGHAVETSFFEKCLPGFTKISLCRKKESSKRILDISQKQDIKSKKISLCRKNESSMFLRNKTLRARKNILLALGWLQVVGALKLYVSFEKKPYKTDDILQKRPVILRSLLIVATPLQERPCVLLLSNIFQELTFEKSLSSRILSCSWEISVRGRLRQWTHYGVATVSRID